MSKPIEELTFADNFMFGAVLARNIDLCKEILEIILDKKIGRISYSNTEQYFEATPDSRAVYLDVYLEDDMSKAYDMEMQAYDEPDIAARSRYYQANVDINLMAKGMEYKDLRESYIIFICTRDYFGHGLRKYTYENICHETGDSLGDRTRKIFLNAGGMDDTISEELRELLNYVAGKGAHNDLTRRIDAEVISARKDRRVKMSYLAYDLALQKSRNDGWNDGWNDGIEHRLLEQICTKLKKGKSNAQIADELEESPENIDRITSVARDFAPEYDLKKISEKLHEKDKLQTIQ